MVIKESGELKTPRRKGPLTPVAEILASRFPDLKKKLKMADMDDNHVEYLEKVVSSSILISAGLVVLSFVFLYDSMMIDLRAGSIVWLAFKAIAVLVGVPAIVFTWLMFYADASVIRRQKEMDYEIVFAGRHIVIALKSGMPLFDTFVGASNGYGAVSREFAKIVDQVVLGVPVTQAIRDVVQYNPSKYFTRMLMQIANALSSGADVGSSLESVLDQISKEQIISLKEYSQKLTPIVMFYMVFGIIVPTLGVVLITVILSAIGSKGLPSMLLWIVFLIIALIQVLFLGLVESSRPRYLI